jgi:hypothetical protein
VKQALTWISHRKAATGTWGSTQATILAMRALLEGSATPLGQDFASTVTLQVNGTEAARVHLNRDNSDVLQQVDLTRHLRAGENRIEFGQQPVGELSFQLAGAYWLPALAPANRAAAPIRPATEPLEIQVEYDRTTFRVDEQLKCSVTVRNNTGVVLNMAIVDLGIPPGFSVDTSHFEEMQQAGRIERFEVTGTQVVLYLRELSDAMPFRFSYALRAKYPLCVQTPTSAAYEYYQPKNRAQSRPATLEAVGN